MVMWRKLCQRLAPSTRAASRTSWSRLSRAASRTMNTNGVHCHVSPMITATRASHGSVTHVKSRRPSADPDRLERPLRGVGHHQEHVADADRGDRQRDQEHDPEEAPPRDLLDGQHRQPEPEHVLEARCPRTRRSASRSARRAGRRRWRSAWTRSQTKPTKATPADQPEGEAERPVPAAPDGARPGPARQRRRSPTTIAQPSGFGGLQDAEEVAPLERRTAAAGSW